MQIIEPSRHRRFEGATKTNGGDREGIVTRLSHLVLEFAVESEFGLVPVRELVHDLAQSTSG